MATKKKLLQAAAGAAGGEALNVEDVFSTYLFDSSASVSPVTVTNGIDLAGEGGMVWVKSRTDAGASPTQNNISDTERGTGNKLITNGTYANIVTPYENCSAFNSDGFAYNDGFGASTNKASWTFRKAPKFFDVVTYTGDGTAGRTVSHNLGSVPGCIIVKETSSATNWAVYHRSIGASNTLWLDLTNASSASSNWNSTAPTDSVFTLGSAGHMNGNGDTYVAYLFAHNDGDGDFGPDGDADIIKCGSYAGNSSINEIDLGFEAQWVLIKSTTDAQNWMLYDAMRGMVSLVGTASDAQLSPNLSGDEVLVDTIAASANGFTLENSSLSTNRAGKTYIYIAIRRGPMAVPEDATDVFAIDTRGGTSPTPPAYYSGFPVDLQVWKSSITASNNWEARDRLRGTYGRVKLNLTDAEDSNGGNEFFFDQMLGQGSATGTNTSRYSWMWRRAPNYFDVVAYTGNGTRGLTVSHNLGVAPEMMWVKGRDNAFDWTVYHKDAAASGTVAESSALELNNTNAVAAAGYVFWDNTAPTSSVITLGNNAQVNQSGYNYIAYLFASLDGVSKVGSYTGNGSSNGDSQNIDCGFSSGARLVLIKRTDNTGNWLLFDTSRGIVSSGNDPALLVNSTGSNFTGFDFLEPNSNGVNVLYNDVSSSYNPNISGATYIFYAIA